MTFHKTALLYFPLQYEYVFIIHLGFSNDALQYV